MGYEEAPATKMLATRCAACGRPLVDAVSVETGIGPDCRDKYGYNGEVPEVIRTEANAIVYRIALEQEGPEVGQLTERLRDLGFDSLADRVLNRVCAVRIEVEGDRLVVRTPYQADAVAAMGRVRGRQWDKQRKVNTFPSDSRADLWTVIRRFFTGRVGHGPKGVFVI